jgi:hypothetical protein
MVTNWWEIAYELSLFGFHTWHDSYYQRGGYQYYFFRSAPW